MKKTILAAVLSICSVSFISAQEPAGKKTSGNYTIRNSASFESPKGHAVQDPIVMADGSVLQINADGVESFNIQSFSKDLKMVKENTVNVRDKFSERAQFWGFVKFKTKVYAFAREVFRETDQEGVTALEIDPKNLNVTGSAKNLFKSSNKVRFESVIETGYGAAVYFGNAAANAYDMFISDDESKFMITYALTPKERNDKLNNDVIGMMVYDENLGKLWGDEYVMPYTEAKMDNLGYTVTNDGKVCLLARVYEGESKKDGAKDKTKPNYHFEVLVYQKGSKDPKKIEIRLDNYFNKEAYIYENNGKIVVGGFYGKKVGAGVDGAYIVTLDVEKSMISKVNGGYYELPTQFLETFMSDRQKKKAEKKMEEDEDYDLELNYLRIRAIYCTPDGSTKIVSEINYVIKRTDSNGHTTYTYVYNDVVLMNIKNNKLDWVNKIPKSTANGFGRGLSINSLIIGDNLYIFWKDKPENSNLPAGEKPKKFGGTNGMLRACMIDAKGQMKFTDIVDVAPYDMHFDIKNFVDGGYNNLISTERRKKENMIFSIDVKP